MNPLRSILFTPGDRSALVEKAANSDADAVCIDLEDSVPQELKQAAREGVSSAASTLRKAGKIVCIRINNTLQNIDLDINNLTKECDFLVIPKVADNRQLVQICETTEMLAKQYQSNLRCIAMVEDAGSLLSLKQNLQFNHQSLFGLTLGTEDLANALHCKPDAALISHCFHELALLCRHWGVELLGFPDSIGEYQDLTVYRNSVETGRVGGASGSFAIHPRQLNVLNSVFRTTEQEISWATSVIEAFEQAKSEGVAVTSVNGQMIDQPVYDRAKLIVANEN